MEAGERPVAGTAGAGPDRDIIVEVVPGIHDPEDGGMVVVGVEGEDLLLRIACLGQNARNAADILIAIDGRDRLDADVRVQAVVDLGGVFEIIPVADRAVADVAGDEQPLSRVNGDEAGIGVVDRAVG